MMPDEKKPIPWGLPPLRSEAIKEREARAAVAVSEKSQSESSQSVQYYPEPMEPYNHDGPKGYRPLEYNASGTSNRARMAVLAVGTAMVLGTLFYVGMVCLCPRHEGSCADTIAAVDKLVHGGLDSSNTVAWERLAEMTDLYGNRMTASKAYDLSADWVVRTVNEQDANLTAYTEPVWVNQWSRNSESLHLFVPTRPQGKVELKMLGLGNSVATPDGGVEANVIPVHSFEELAQLGNATIAGNIVMFNFPSAGYEHTAVFRVHGAREAEKYGALAVLVRTLSPDSAFDSVHTGSSQRAGIPAASISLADANYIERMYVRAKAGKSADHVAPRVRLVMNAQLRENFKQSANVIIDLKGSERPEEIVLLSGHFDSWDVGVGAMDDGAGAFLAWEAARMIANLGRAPRRTIRVVMWNNEETLQRGSHAYFEKHKDEISNHTFAIESDSGVFDPWGLVVAAEQTLVDKLKGYGAHLFGDLGGGNIAPSDVDTTGEDIAILCEHGVPCGGFLSINPENGAAPGEPEWQNHYFRFHHASSDRIEIIDKHQLRRSAASLAAWAYLIADQ
ncbi:hypothetical protein H4R20_003256 [Coemansia guatemalensis]|uniref:Peptide hydrolase n=1 Tax=Coemansia guatemalensis TaxID=2761395 RepID=A0A9W8HZY9_9FUNG|nr:hypothetical protein H4R20_003256 [Coemansia guatemalensis]